MRYQPLALITLDSFPPLQCSCYPHLHLPVPSTPLLSPPGAISQSKFSPTDETRSLLLPACRSELIEIEVSFLSLGAGAAVAAAAALRPFRPPPCVIPSIHPYFSHLGDF